MVKTGTKLKSKYEYRPRDPGEVRRRAERSSQSYDSIFKEGFDTYKPKVGDNTIRFLPPTWDDPKHYAYTIFVHNNVGPGRGGAYLCRKMIDKSCPICDAQMQAQRHGEEEDANQLRATERAAVYLLDRKENQPTPRLYNMPRSTDKDICALVYNKNRGTALYLDNPDEGFDVSFQREGNDKHTKYRAFQIDVESTPISDDTKTRDKIMTIVEENPIPTVLNFFSEEYLQGLLSGTVDDQREDRDPAPADEDDEDDEPLETKRDRKRESDEEEREARLSAKSASKSAKKRPRDEVEDEDEDNVEDEAPRKKRKVATVEDYDDDDLETEDDEADEDDGEDEADEEPEERPRGKVRAKNGGREDAEDEDDADEEKPRRKPAQREQRRVDNRRERR